METISIFTKKKQEVLNITNEVEKAVNNSGITNGACLIFGRHTTCSVMLGEYEPGLDDDFLNMFEQLKPKGPFKHAHEPDHAPSHLFSSMVGEQVSVPISDGKLALGTWQKVMLVEFNGPRERTLIIHVLK